MPKEGLKLVGSLPLSHVNPPKSLLPARWVRVTITHHSVKSRHTVRPTMQHPPVNGMEVLVAGFFFGIMVKDSSARMERRELKFGPLV